MSHDYGQAFAWGLSQTTAWAPAQAKAPRAVYAARPLYLHFERVPMIVPARGA